ncbi:alpha-tocopherol transfer protein-like isoform X2 [Daktulosphaira vitifoliae]|uniref:alpha-tocopherol transfer protein-like isoform X2 n=1 Tax=Daktulosphaira vitifoliae TaxID=58002 RepID=UPI0021AA089E|nr:alpha-tocopherol transfer protein-like isoform X2 [Daktulosphaira vitifoliae]
MYTPSTSFDEYFQYEQKKYPQLKIEDIQELKKKLKDEKQLPPISDKILVAFLHSCYFDLESAHNTVINCYKSFFETPNLFCDLDPIDEKIKNQFECTTWNHLTYDNYDKKEHYLYIQYDNITNFQLFDPLSDYKIMILWMEYLLLCHGTCDAVNVVINCINIQWRHIFKSCSQISMIHKMLNYEGLPVRLNKLHIMNSGKSMQYLFKIVKPFIKSQLVNKIKFYSNDSEDIYSHVPKSIFPEDIGGTSLSCKALFDSFQQNLNSCREWYVEQNEIIRRQINTNKNNK